MYKRIVLTSAIFALLIILGCSGNTGGALPSMPDYGQRDEIPALGESAQPGDELPEIYDSTIEPGGHVTWGLFRFVADPEHETLDVYELRTGQLHLNSLHFLEPPPYVFLSVENIKYNGNIIDVDVGLRHPLLGLIEYTGFDVCGVLITNGSYSGFTDSKIIHAGPGDTRLLNPDGHSRWWNPAEFPENPNQPVFGYIEGMLGTPDDVADYNCTLNGYKYFCDDLHDPDDPLSKVTLERRGMFSAGQKNVRHYTIELGIEGLIFNYAVDASWKFPDGYPPWKAPDDFGEKANRVEAWNISVTETSNTLYFDDGQGGGGLSLTIDIYDWFNAEQNVVYVEATGGVVPQIGPIYPSGGGPGYSTYDIDIISAQPTTAGDLDILITAECEAEGFQGFLQGVKTSAYLIYTAQVSGEAPEVVDDNGCFGTALAIDENNVIHTAYADYENLYWSYSMDKGQHWVNFDSVYVPADGLNISANSLAMSSGPADGYVYISWAETAGTTDPHRKLMAGRMPIDLLGNLQTILVWEHTSGNAQKQSYDSTQILALGNGEFLVYAMWYAGTGDFNPKYCRTSSFEELEGCPELDVNPTNGSLTYIYTPYTPALAADSNSDVFYANSGLFNHAGNTTGGFLLENTGSAASNNWSFFTSYHHSGSSMYWDNRSNGVFIDESDTIHWVSEYQTDGTGPYGNNSGSYYMVYGEGPSDGPIILTDPIPNMQRTVPFPYENAHYDYEWVCTSVVEDGAGLTYIVFQDCRNRLDAYYITWDGTDWHHTDDWVKINTADDQNAYMPYAIRGLDGYVYVTYTDQPDTGGPGLPVFAAIKDS